jgi:hypothetical protein
MSSTMLNASAKLVLTLLLNFNGAGGCKPKIETLARRSGQCRRTVERALRRLAELKLIRIVWRQRQSTYELAAMELWPELLIRQSVASEPNPDTTTCRNVSRQDVVSEPSVYLLNRSIEKSGGTHHTREKVGAISNGAATVAVCVSPLEESQRELAAVLAVFADFGRGCSAADVKRCERAWAKLTPAERRAVGLHLGNIIPAWRCRPTAKIAHPWNYLEGRYWERDIPRKQPVRSEGEAIRQEQLMRTARMAFGKRPWN